MCGHSLGGYVSTFYALRYPQNIKKLVLFSPVGIPPAPTQNDPAELARESDSFKTSCFLWVAGNVWIEGNSPFKTARKYGLLKMGIKRYVTGRLGIKD